MSTRKNEVKAVKDMETAKDMTRFLLGLEGQRVKLKKIYSGFAKRWKKILLEILQREKRELYDFLSE